MELNEIYEREKVKYYILIYPNDLRAKIYRLKDSKYDKIFVDLNDDQNCIDLAAKNMKDMVEISKKQVDQANEQLKEVVNQYKYLNIKAPNDGVIIKKNINTGEMALPGMPAFILSDLSNLKVVVEVSEHNLRLVPYGTIVQVSIPSVNFYGNGKVTAIIPTSNPMTHTFKIKVSFKHRKDLIIYPGMYATVTIPK